MPSLIINEGVIDRENEEKEEIKIDDEILQKHLFEGRLFIPPEYNPTARKLMWIGVVTMAVVIFGLWMWSLSVQFGGVKWSNSPEKNLIANTKKNWEESFNQSDRSTEELKSEIKNNLEKLLSGLNASSTSEIITTSTGKNVTSTLF